MRVRLLLISADTTLRESAKREARGFPVLFDTVPSPQHAERLYAQFSDSTPQAILIDPRGVQRETSLSWARRTFPDSRAIFFLPEERSGVTTTVVAAYDPEAWNGDSSVCLAGAHDREGFRGLLRLLVEGAAAGSDGARVNGLDELIGRSVRFRETLDQAMKLAAQGNEPILLVGEKGTGKRLFARAIHGESETQGPLIRFDCRALTARGLDAILAGDTSSLGRNSDAVVAPGSSPSGGTLFLEEISALDAQRQVKLSHFLLEQRRAARQKAHRAAVWPRLIAATAKDLSVLARAGSFHAELWGALKPNVVSLPPLRERPSDILLLAERFMHRKAATAERPLPALSRAVQERLLGHPWPGNIRELFGVLEAALEAAGGLKSVEPEHLPDWLHAPAVTDISSAQGRGTQLAASAGCAAGSGRVVVTGDGVVVDLPEEGIAFEEIERAILRAALEKTENNVVRAARLLRLGRGSLRYRLEKFGLVEPRRRRSARRRPVALDGVPEDDLKRAS